MNLKLAHKPLLTHPPALAATLPHVAATTNQQADAEETGNVGFALYEKVHRAKNRWRCNLRYGVFFINGREYMFNKGSTDLTF